MNETGLISVINRWKSCFLVDEQMMQPWYLTVTRQLIGWRRIGVLVDCLSSGIVPLAAEFPMYLFFNLIKRLCLTRFAFKLARPSSQVCEYCSGSCVWTVDRCCRICLCWKCERSPRLYAHCSIPHPPLWDFQPSFDVHTVFIFLRVLWMQPLARLRQKMLKHHWPAYKKQGQCQIKALVKLPWRHGWRDRELSGAGIEQIRWRVKSVKWCKSAGQQKWQTELCLPLSRSLSGSQPFPRLSCDVEQTWRLASLRVRRGWNSRGLEVEGGFGHK